jgi:hypothetical protein
LSEFLGDSREIALVNRGLNRAHAIILVPDHRHDVKENLLKRISLNRKRQKPTSFDALGEFRAFSHGLTAQPIKITDPSEPFLKIIRTMG